MPLKTEKSKKEEGEGRGGRRRKGGRNGPNEVDEEKIVIVESEKCLIRSPFIFA